MRSAHTKLVLVSSLATVAGTLALTGCASKSVVTNWQANGTPVHVDELHPWWSYELVYHPSSGVYFEPYSHTYHWQESGEWRSSKTRPEPVAWHADEAVVVKLNWDTPEYGHTTVASLHPAIHTWNRSNPITVDPAASSNNTALTNATEQEQPE